MALSDVARELYRVAPSEFVAARKANATELKAHGDSSLAVEVGKLAKPSVSAWMVNLLVFPNAALQKEFAELASKLRDAQADPDRATISRLVADRRTLLARAVKDAQSLAKKAGVTKVAQTAVAQIELTLTAALADEDALAAVFSGRLVRALEADGFEPVDLSDAVAGDPPPHKATAASKSRSTGSTKSTKAREAAIKAAERAESAAAEAESAVDALKHSQATHDSADEKLAADIADLQERFDQLEAQRTKLDEEESQLKRDLSRAQDARRRADAEARTARARADRLK